MFHWNRFALRAGTALLATALLAPAVASAEMYAWRTEDGVFAYADDREKIPSRYAAEAVRVRSQRLGSYDRLTIQDSEASSAVTGRLRERLAYLRAFNASASEPAATAGAAASTVTVATGSPQVPSLDIRTDEASGPVVVETVMGKGHGQLLTRSATIVSQGGRTLAVVKGRRNQHNLSTDIVDLDEVAAGR